MIISRIKVASTFQFFRFQSCCSLCRQLTNKAVGQPQQPPQRHARNPQWPGCENPVHSPKPYTLSPQGLPSSKGSDNNFAGPHKPGRSDSRRVPHPKPDSPSPRALHCTNTSAVTKPLEYCSVYCHKHLAASDSREMPHLRIRVTDDLQAPERARASKNTHILRIRRQQHQPDAL